MLRKVNDSIPQYYLQYIVASLTICESLANLIIKAYKQILNVRVALKSKLLTISAILKRENVQEIRCLKILQAVPTVLENLCHQSAKMLAQQKSSDKDF